MATDECTRCGDAPGSPCYLDCVCSCHPSRRTRGPVESVARRRHLGLTEDWAPIESGS